MIDASHTVDVGEVLSERYAGEALEGQSSGGAAIETDTLCAGAQAPRDFWT